MSQLSIGEVTLDAVGCAWASRVSSRAQARFPLKLPGVNGLLLGFPQRHGPRESHAESSLRLTVFYYKLFTRLSTTELTSAH